MVDAVAQVAQVAPAPVAKASVAEAETETVAEAVATTEVVDPFVEMDNLDEDDAAWLERSEYEKRNGYGLGQGQGNCQGQGQDIDELWELSNECGPLMEEPYLVDVAEVLEISSEVEDLGTIGLIEHAYENLSISKTVVFVSDDQDWDYTGDTLVSELELNSHTVVHITAEMEEDPRAKYLSLFKDFEQGYARVLVTSPAMWWLMYRDSAFNGIEGVFPKCSEQNVMFVLNPNDANLLDSAMDMLQSGSENYVLYVKGL